MNPDEMIRAAARVMDLNFDPKYRELIANELFAQLARESRERLEQQGIGLESELSPQRFYSIEEFLGRLLTIEEHTQVTNARLEELLNLLLELEAKLQQSKQE